MKVLEWKSYAAIKLTISAVQHINMQYKAHTGVGLISDSGFILFDWNKLMWNTNLWRQRESEAERRGIC